MTTDVLSVRTMDIDVKSRWIAGGVLDDGQTIAYPAVYSREEAWAFVAEHYPGRCLVRHIRATVDNMPAQMSAGEIPLFFSSLD
jgi:hypothetical protein